MLLPNLIDHESENLLPQDGRVIYLPNFLTLEEERLYFSELKSSIKWRADKIKMFGREVDIPRLQAWYGDPGKVYTYSKLKLDPEPWISPLLKLKEKIEKKTSNQFNSLLINFYRSGNDHVSWHADDEPELGDNPCIASLSLGEVRRFQLKHKRHDLPTLSLDLGSGSRLIMSEEIQENWVHRLVQTKKSSEERINLTFRFIK